MGQIDLGQIGTGTNWPKLGRIGLGQIGLGTNWPVSVNASIKNFVSLLDELWIPINIAGVDPGFQVRGDAFKKLRRAEGVFPCIGIGSVRPNYTFALGPFALKVGLFALIIK